MKLAKISLAAAVAICGLSTVSFAQPLEEAIKGVDVSGYLRYRYDDDRYSDKGNVADKSATTANHKWRALANFKTPVVNNVAFNVGILYINEAHKTNDGATVGSGFGAGEDGDFGVNTYYATITPDSTKTTIMVGKQLLDTPLTDASDFDRGTGILALNSDVPNWTFALGAYDTFALTDVNGYTSGSSVTEALYVAAAIAKYGNFSAQAWFHSVPDIVDSSYYLNAAYKGVAGNVNYGVSGTYVFTTLADDTFKNQAEDQDLYKIEAEAGIKPVKLTLGYIGNTQDGYSVAFDSNPKGIITAPTMGQIWWQNAATGIRLNPLHGQRKAVAKDAEDELSVFYATAAWDVTDSVKLSLTYVNGEAEYTAKGAKTKSREFQEITPMINYKHSKNLSLAAFYSMLETEITDVKNDEERNRFRFQALYRF
ncbi:MAG: major outer membrane protein [Wolinella sp.]